VEYIMAGCSTVQVCSAKYLKGVKVLGEMLAGLEAFMDRKGYSSVEEFRGVALEKMMMLRDLPKEEGITLPSPIQPQFDMAACTGCGLCEELCPYAALTVDTEKGNWIDEEYCLGCGMCVGQCPEDAIKLVHLATGDVVWENRGLHRIWVKD
jgi:heterodisulfide reductase subunit A-like polyferredoxin